MIGPALMSATGMVATGVTAIAVYSCIYGRKKPPIPLNKKPDTRQSLEIRKISAQRIRPLVSNGIVSKVDWQAIMRDISFQYFLRLSELIMDFCPGDPKKQFKIALLNLSSKNMISAPHPEMVNILRTRDEKIMFSKRTKPAELKEFLFAHFYCRAHLWYGLTITKIPDEILPNTKDMFTEKNTFLDVLSSYKGQNVIPLLRHIINHFLKDCSASRFGNLWGSLTSTKKSDLFNKITEFTSMLRECLNSEDIKGAQKENILLLYKALLHIKLSLMGYRQNAIYRSWIEPSSAIEGNSSTDIAITMIQTATGIFEADEYLCQQYNVDSLNLNNAFVFTLIPQFSGDLYPVPMDSIVNACSHLIENLSPDDRLSIFNTFRKTGDLKKFLPSYYYTFLLLLWKEIISYDTKERCLEVESQLEEVLPASFDKLKEVSRSAMRKLQSDRSINSSVKNQLQSVETGFILPNLLKLFALYKVYQGGIALRNDLKKQRAASESPKKSDTKTIVSEDLKSEGREPSPKHYTSTGSYSPAESSKIQFRKNASEKIAREYKKKELHARRNPHQEISEKPHIDQEKKSLPAQIAKSSFDASTSLRSSSKKTYESLFQKTSKGHFSNDIHITHEQIENLIQALGGEVRQCNKSSHKVLTLKQHEIIFKGERYDIYNDETISANPFAEQLNKQSFTLAKPHKSKNVSSIYLSQIRRLLIDQGFGPGASSSTEQF
tara:strand:+ start:123 stop:2282 length:2160 start_codon:yes stop_codon:yes gene_type:complete